MADTTVSSTPPKKRRGFLRALAWIFGILLILIVLAYFVGTSSAFFKGVILPRVSKALNADVTVSDASISPFKEVVLHNLKVQAAGQEPVLTAPEVRAHYSLMDIIGGKISVDEVAVSSPTIALIENADGSRNIDPILKAQKEKPETQEAKKPAEAAKPSKPPQIDIKKVALSGATIRYVKAYKEGTRDVDEISNLSVTLDNLKNGQTGKLAMSADISAENHPPGTNGTLQAKLNGNFSFALSEDLKPGSVQGNTRLEVASASGFLAELATFGTTLDCEVTPTEVKQVALRFTKGGSQLGQVLVSGPFEMEKTEGKLTVQILSLDKQLLNLAGAKSGLDFGPTTINSTNQIGLAKGGALITAAGHLSLNKFQVSRTNQTTPALDLLARYDVSVDRTASNALLRDLTINGTQKGSPLVHADLASPMSFSWGNAANPVGDSTLNLTITNFNLADWKAFTGDAVSSGTLGAQVRLLSQQAGKLLAFSLDSQLQKLSPNFGSNHLTNAGITLKANGRAVDLKQFNILAYQIDLAQNDLPVATVSGTAAYDTAAQSADAQVNMQVQLTRLLQIAPQQDANFTSGKLDLQMHVIQRAETAGAKSGSNTIQTVTGTMALSDLTGHFGKNDFQGFGLSTDLDVTKTPAEIQIRRVTGKLGEGGKPGGSFDLTGSYALDTKAAQISAKLNDINQDGLRPFLEPMLQDKKLRSVSINATVATQYNPSQASAVKADVTVTNIVVTDPKGQAPARPLEAKLHVDTALNKQVAELRQVSVTLTPTDRAKNELRLEGRVDMSQTNATQGNLKLSADSLDFTSYYDLFAGESPEKPGTTGKPATTSTGNAGATNAPSGPAKEPEGMKLPLKNFVAEVAIDRMYLHEVEVTNLQTTAKIDGGHVVLNPFKLALNGAPVNANADLDLGVPGYKYDAGFSLQAVPLPPLVNSFAPDRKGQIGGTLSAQAKVTGAGITGASLQKNLTGNFDVFSTNLNLAVVNVKSPLLKTLVNVVGSLPELIKNPLGAIPGLFGGGGLADDLKKSPLDAITVKGTAGAGNVALQQATVLSPAFRADASGTVALAPVLTNSAIRIPVSVSLSHALAEKIGVLPANQPANAAYAKLPDFFAMKGTVGEPKSDINKVALGTLALRGVAGAVPVKGTAGQILQGVNSLLGGQNSNPTSAPPQSAGSPGATNAPPKSASAPAATNQSPLNLLDQFLQPKPKKK